MPDTAISIRRPGRAPYVLSLLLLIAAGCATIASLARPDLIHGPAVSVGSLRGTALVVLVVAMPLLALSMAAVRRGSTLALLGWLGSVGYIGYQSVLFLFGSPFNGLFPAYLGMLSFAGWTLVTMAPVLPVAEIAGRFGPRTPVRAVAGYLTVMTLLFYALWLRAIVPALFASESPAFLEGTGMITGPGQIMDLAFLLPLCLLTSAWVWQRRAAGIVLAGIVQVGLVIETISIGVDQWFGALADPSSPVVSAAMAPAFGVVTLVALLVLGAFLRGTRRDTGNRDMASLAVTGA
jgi:hypothetical protein